MFYEATPGKTPRLGDVATGFVWAAPQIDRPLARPSERFAIHVEQPQFVVLLTPCCSIEKGEVVVAPLEQIRPSLLTNPYLEADLTRVNRPMKPEQTVPPKVWEEMPDDHKRRRYGVDLDEAQYTFVDTFVYENHGLLPEYNLHRKGGPVRCAHYMASFKHVCRVACKEVKRPETSEIGTKLLELSVQTRDELRKKLVCYFGRMPVEDRAALGLV